MIALLFLSSGQGRKYLETFSLPDRLGKHLIEKVAKISVKREAIFSGMPQNSAFCLALVNIFFNSDLCQHLKGGACEVCEYCTATGGD